MGCPWVGSTADEFFFEAVLCFISSHLRYIMLRFSSEAFSISTANSAEDMRNWAQVPYNHETVGQTIFVAQQKSAITSHIFLLIYKVLLSTDIEDVKN